MVGRQVGAKAQTPGVHFFAKTAALLKRCSMASFVKYFEEASFSVSMAAIKAASSSGVIVRCFWKFFAAPAAPNNSEGRTNAKMVPSGGGSELAKTSVY